MSATFPVLPCEVLDVVARHLTGDGARGTCASLNATSHAVYAATLQTLWTQMYWVGYHDSTKYKKEDVEEKWKIFKASPGAQYIRQVLRLIAHETGC